MTTWMDQGIEGINRADDLKMARKNALGAIARAEKAVDDLCQGRLRWEMRVPAEPDHDPDLIISEALSQARRIIEGL